MWKRDGCRLGFIVRRRVVREVSPSEFVWGVGVAIAFGMVELVDRM